MSLSQDKINYIQEYIRQAFEGYSSSRSNYFYTDRDNIASVRDYMHGDIPAVKYQKILEPEELANEDSTPATIDWTPLDIYSKYRRIAIEIILQMKEDITIDIIDSMAMDEKEDFYGDLASKIYLRDKLLENGVDPKTVGLPTELPEDQKELEMYMEFSYKHVAAIEFKTVLSLLKERSRYGEIIYRKLIEDLHDLGVCITQDVEDKDGEIRAEYVDPVNFICSYSRSGDFEDIEFAGVVNQMTIADCKMKTKNEGEIQMLDELERATNPSSPVYQKYEELRNRLFKHQSLDSAYFNVLHLEFISGESEEYELRVTKSGRKVFGRKSKGKNGKEFMTADYEVVYEGYYVLGSDCFFGIKKKDFTLRDPDDVKCAKLTYHITAPECNRMSFNSIGKQVRPAIDACNIAWFKLQNAIRKARPDGIAYDLTSLEAVSFGAGGLSPEDNISTFMRSGNLAIRMIDEDGKFQRMPIQSLPGGLGKNGEDFMTQIQMNENLFRTITGLNELVDGSSPNPRTLKSVAQQAATSTNNALKFIHNSASINEMSLSRNLLERVLDQAETDEVEMYIPSVGKNTVNFLKMSKDHSMRQLGLKFQPKPTAEEDQEFKEALNLALTQPKGGEAQITLDQATMLKQIDNKKYAMAYLSYVVSKNIEEAKNEKIMNMQQQDSFIKEQSMVAESEKRKTLEMELAMKERLEHIKGGYEIKVAQIKAAGDVEQDMIKAEARDRESQRLNQTKESIENRKMENQESVPTSD